MDVKTIVRACDCQILICGKISCLAYSKRNITTAVLTAIEIRRNNSDCGLSFGGDMLMTEET